MILGMFIGEVTFSLEWVDVLNVWIGGDLHRSEGHMVLDTYIIIHIEFLSLINKK